MTSIATQAEVESGHLYSDVAEKLVVNGYLNIRKHTLSFLEGGEYSKKTFMHELLKRISSMPPLLSSDEFNQLRRSEGLYESEDVLGVVSTILTDKCDEYILEHASLAVTYGSGDESEKIVVRLF